MPCWDTKVLASFWKMDEPVSSQGGIVSRKFKRFVLTTNSAQKDTY